MLNSVQNLAAEQSAQLFCQETYKEQGNSQDAKSKSKSTVFPDIKLSQRNISGKFYPVDAQATLEDFYNALYKNNQNYQAFLNSNSTEDSSGLLKADPGVTPRVYPALQNQVYDNNFVTPANFGIPYLDPDFMQKAFQWNIAMLFGQPDKNNQVISGVGVASSSYEVPNSGMVNGKAYINYNGYRIYVGANTNTKITNIQYIMYNTQGTGTYGADQFKAVTNIDPNNLRTLRAQTNDKGYTDGMQLITQGYEGSVYLQYLTVVKIDYSVEVGYQGVTPMKKMIEFIQSYSVNGLNGSKPNKQQQTFNEDATDTLTGTCYYWMVA